MSTLAPPLLSPGLLLRTYAQGIFPMMHDGGELNWHDPDPRAIVPLHITADPRTSRFYRNNGYSITRNRCFTDVMHGCADRETTWINEEMIEVYSALHETGHAHSVETWQDGELIGGLYGVALGGAFFGESMFSRRTNASKAAFHHLLEHLRTQGFRLFDTQYLNDHTRSLGAVEVPRSTFRNMLADALRSDARF